MSAPQLIAGRFRVDRLCANGDNGVDVRDGASVMIRSAVHSFVARAAIESRARIAASIDSFWILPVLCWSPRVVYATPPPPTRPTTPLAVGDAVGCLLQICDVLSRAHAAGLSGLTGDAEHVRIHPAAEGHRATVVLPALWEPGDQGQPVGGGWLDPVSEDIVTALGVLTDLLRPGPQDPAVVLGLRPDRPPSLDDPRVDELVARLLARDTADDLPKDVASLAARFVHLAHDGWRPIVAAMPRAPEVLAAPRDWDRIIELGEAELAQLRGGGRDAEIERPYVTLALAAALHQRACVAHARRDHATALRDVERALALDPWPRYLITRGVLRAAIGDVLGASADYDLAVTIARDCMASPARVGFGRVDRESPMLECARALYARGVAQLQAGEIAAAQADLAEAASLAQTLRPRFGADRRAELASLEARAERALGTAKRRLARAGAAASGARM